MNVKLKIDLRDIWAGYKESEGKRGVEEEFSVLPCINGQRLESFTDAWNTKRKTNMRDKYHIVVK